MINFPMLEGLPIRKFLYIVDLDDTLLNRSACLSENILKGISNLIEQGALITYITGRNWTSSYEIMNKTNIQCPVGVLNGALIIDFNSGKHLKCFSIDKEIIESIFLFMSEFKVKLIITVAINNKVKRYAVNNNNNIKFKNNIEFVVDEECECVVFREMLNNNIISISIEGYGDNFKELYQALKDKFYKYVNINLYNDPIDKRRLIINLLSADISKGVAAEFISQYLNISCENMVAFGDSIIDLELLEKVGKGISIGNTLPQLGFNTYENLVYDEGISVIKYIEEHYKRNEEKI